MIGRPVGVMFLSSPWPQTGSGESAGYGHRRRCMFQIFEVNSHSGTGQRGATLLSFPLLNRGEYLESKDSYQNLAHPRNCPETVIAIHFFCKKSNHISHVPT